ncbi:probable 4-coumarate--CoA ligase 1 [Topomyia yanbarensis]|uniref:probable 4-coumarate--CoA ligase 1 n=1 Tax=Topomyia yanbarensis TaxID=2498891 RepID=UPI00273BEDEE|nr:probable 4-coumarate--CoA ligase 1 [Topomyia yanbarensis]
MFHTFNPTTKEWISRHPPPAIDPQANLGQLILNVLDRNPSKVLQLDTDTSRQLIAQEMRLRSIRVAQNLTGLGFGKGDMAALVCSNSENLTSIALGLMIAGVPFITLPVGFNATDLGHLMGLVQPKLVICDETIHKTVLEGAGQTLKIKPVIFVIESERESVRKVDELLGDTGSEAEFVPQYHGDMRSLIGIILCTSGTTGRPKGVCVSQAHIAIILSRPATAYGNTDLIFNFSPLYWGTGLFALLNSISMGTTRAISRSLFNEDVFFDVLERHKPTHFFSPPSHAVLLLSHPRAENADFSSVRSWSLSGSHASPQLRQAIQGKLSNGRTYNSYASSEIGLIAMDMMKGKEGTVGQLMPHLDAKVVDEGGIAVGVGEQGEILIRTKIPFMGYYGDEAANRELIDSDGWIRTGDIGYFDEEGFLTLVDRVKDVIKYRGYQMSPVDLEAVIGRIDGVRQVCVVGISEMSGSSDLPAAVIVRQRGSELTERQVLETVDREVSDHKRLRGGVFFWPELPLTGTGKVLRRVVQQRLQEIVGREV